MTHKNTHRLKRIAGGVLAVLLMIGLVACDGATNSAEYEPPSAAVAASVAWLQTQVNEDGGYGIDFETGDAASSVSTTLDALLALAAGDADVVAQRDYLQAHSAELNEYAALSGGAAGKIILALEAVTADPTNFAGADWIALTNSHEADGVYAPDAFNQALAVLGLATTGEAVLERAVQELRDLQADDGSWDDGFGTLQNPDATAMAIQALLAAGASPDDADIAAALAFLENAQLPTAGWEYGVGFGESANTTAVTIQALLALGEDFYSSESDWAVNGITPLDALLSYQSESGAFQFFDADDLFATLQSLPALAGTTYADMSSGDSR